LGVTRPHRRGFPCCVGSPCAGMPPPIPRWNPWNVSRHEGWFPLVSRDGGLPRIATGSASTSPCFGACMAFTRVAACLLAELPKGGPWSRRLRRLRHLRRRSDSYRLERPVAGRESHPLKIRAFSRRTATHAPSPAVTLTTPSCSAQSDVVGSLLRSEQTTAHTRLQRLPLLLQSNVRD
jgi:hypothetical protein